MYGAINSSDASYGTDDDHDSSVRFFELTIGEIKGLVKTRLCCSMLSPRLMLLYWIIFYRFRNVSELTHIEIKELSIRKEGKVVIEADVSVVLRIGW